MNNELIYYQIDSGNMFLNNKEYNVDLAQTSFNTSSALPGTSMAMFVAKARKDYRDEEFGVLVNVFVGASLNQTNTYKIDERSDMTPSFRLCAEMPGIDFKHSLGGPNTYLGNYGGGLGNPFVETRMYAGMVTTFTTSMNYGRYASPPGVGVVRRDVRENYVSMAIDNVGWPLRLGLQLNSFFNPDYINGVDGATRLPISGPQLYSTIQTIGTAQLFDTNQYFRSSLNIEWLYDLFRKSTQDNENVPLSDREENPDEWTTTKFLHIGTLDFNEFTGEFEYTEPQNVIIEMTD